MVERVSLASTTTGAAYLAMARSSSDCTLANEYQRSLSPSKEAEKPGGWRKKKALKRVISPVLVIHGGAGTFTRDQSTPEKKELYRNALRLALLRGHEILEAGGEAMDAATAAVATMEGEFQVIDPTKFQPSMSICVSRGCHPRV